VFAATNKTTNKTTTNGESSSDADVADNTIASHDFLYNGHVLIFWRGYGQELTRGRLLLPKIDYLQANIVQKAAGKVRRRLEVVEKKITRTTKAVYDKFENWLVSMVARGLQLIPSQRVAEWARIKLVEVAEKTKIRMREESTRKKTERRISLQRYGGSTDAVAPFMICEVDYENEQGEATAQVNGNSTLASSTTSSLDEVVNHDIYEAMNQGQVSCGYDIKAMGPNGTVTVAPMQLLERVSISNLLDFTPAGTRNLFKTIFVKNELLEPTYQEVIVVWRPLPPKQKKPIFTAPKFAYDFADMFDIDGLPELPTSEDELEEKRPPLEIRAFAGVPMANLPAVLPKTKLVFRPADAFVFDLVSIVSLVLVFGSQRFDNPRLDLLAVVSFSLWVVRTVIRYSNKLARYDLLVKKFLTSKITARNAGALKYVSTEAGSYRATRAALVFTWLTSKRKIVSSACNKRDQLIKDGLVGVNELIAEDKRVRVDIDAALRDLEELGLIFFSKDGQRLEGVIRDNTSLVKALGRKWAAIFDGGARNVLADSNRTTPAL